MTRWRDESTPADWPDWRLERRGRIVIGDPLIRDLPAPDAELIGKGKWVEITIRRAVHTPSSAALEARWRVGRYHLTYHPADDELEGGRYETAQRVLLGLSPRRPGRPSGSGEVTAESVYRTAVEYSLAERRKATQDAIAERLPADVTTVRRAVGESWAIIRDTAWIEAERRRLTGH